jgi:hypothetical protein
MRRLLGLCLLALLVAVQAPAQAQSRVYHQAELDAMLAPVALYPDMLLSQILEATTHPQDLHQAAAWSRSQPHLRGDDALQAVEPMPWHPSVKALVAFPELLARMDESPRWVAELGEAFLYQEPHVLDTVQTLRQRAQASGALQSNEHQEVIQYADAVVVQPVRPHVVYVPYYNPYVVYGSWWWPAYRPVYWRPWPVHTTVIVTHRFASPPDHRRHRPPPRVRHEPLPRARLQDHVRKSEGVRPFVQSSPHGRPIVQSSPHARPFFDGAPRREQRAQPRAEPRREQRFEHRREARAGFEQRREARAERHRGDPRAESNRGGTRAEARQQRRQQGNFR